MTVFFALFLISGFLDEVSTLLGVKCPLWLQVVYLIGAVWFLFWIEPYILHGCIVALLILSLIKAGLKEARLWEPHHQFVDSTLSLFLICLMSSNFMVELFLR